jgi:hypothetical protein
MAGPGSGATEMRSEEWLAAFAKHLMGPDGLEQGWLVLRDLFHSLTDEEMADVVRWCEVWQAQAERQDDSIGARKE